MLSVIIPVLNEEKTIGEIVRNLKKNKSVDEIVVVDDKSSDNTILEAQKEGAKVIISTEIGKGASMRDGLLVSKGEVVVYLDGDVEGYGPDVVEKLSNPIIQGDADFVKSTFMREQGMVTKLATLPLLNIFFPELSQFFQPLSGMIAGKRNFFEQIQFEDDYGVDIGILIDMYLLKARIKEVNIGTIQNKVKLWNKSQMASEVIRTILKKTAIFSLANLEEIEVFEEVRNQMEFAIRERLLTMKKMIVFDMDQTILRGSFIDTLAKKNAFERTLMDIRAKNPEPFIVTKKIAELLKGLNIAEILEVVESIPLVKDVEKVIKILKKRGYIVGIITHSYDCVANHVKNKIGADFALGYDLEFSNSMVTGEVKIPSFFIRNEVSKCSHEMCKLNALICVAQNYKINLNNIIFVGDSEQDICPIKYAGIGVAFCSKCEALNFVSDRLIRKKAFSPILVFAR